MSTTRLDGSTLLWTPVRSDVAITGDGSTTRPLGLSGDGWSFLGLAAERLGLEAEAFLRDGLEPGHDLLRDAIALIRQAEEIVMRARALAAK